MNTKLELFESGNIWENWFKDFDNYSNKIKSYTSFEERRDFLNKVVEKIDVYWDSITNTHNIKIHFHLNIVMDRGKSKDEYIFELKKGKRSCEIKGINSKKFKGIIDKNPLPLTSFLNYSTVTDFAKFLG